MNLLIEKYIKSLTKEQIKLFASEKGANLSQSEVDFLYTFIKNNYKDIINNPNTFNIDNYKNKFSIKNYIIIKEVFNEYFQKFKNYL